MSPSIGSQRTRPPAVAGTFYPAAPSRLRRLTEEFIAAGRPGPQADVKAVIAPHAGYVYSGPVAGSAFRPFAHAYHHDSTPIQRIVLLGPSHWIDFDGLALPDAETFTTPLGRVMIDSTALRLPRTFPQVRVFAAAHRQEHSLEVELPFLQVALPKATIVPLVVGSISDRDLQAVIDALWGGDETRFVISSDLSHYHPYAEASALDHETARMIEQGRPEQITRERACGYQAIRGFLAVANQRHLAATTADLRTSGDTAGPRDRVVGYGAFTFA